MSLSVTGTVHVWCLTFE